VSSRKAMCVQPLRVERRPMKSTARRIIALR
jgi:hypothetical protein